MLISPESFSFGLAFQLVVMVVVGGTGSMITGATLVATVLTLATEFLKPVEESLNLFGASKIVVAVGVILVLIYRPAGLFGTAEPQPLNWIRRLSNRRTSPPPANTAQ
ncbi:hypothetical protein [Breoghania sp.]|uniref:hypothetical protein n=1 Tax=Breoghania sp. TaxID=2065378 RepID=UPI00262BE092|nr:hypothetical protein [Breoghania sp.]MDJ0933580.1 hypothetical protein [Breoghania sp.]